MLRHNFMEGGTKPKKRSKTMSCQSIGHLGRCTNWCGVTYPAPAAAQYSNPATSPLGTASQERDSQLMDCDHPQYIFFKAIIVISPNKS
jgi:hypothetical protein